MRQLWKLQPFFIFFQPCASAKHCLSQSYFLHSTVLSTVPILFRLISEQLRCDSAPLHHHPHTSIPPMPRNTEGDVVDGRPFPSRAILLPHPPTTSGILLHLFSFRLTYSAPVYLTIYILNHKFKMSD